MSPMAAEATVVRNYLELDDISTLEKKKSKVLKDLAYAEEVFKC